MYANPLDKPISGMLASPKLGSSNPLDRPVSVGIPRAATPSAPFDRPAAAALPSPLQSGVYSSSGDSGGHQRPHAIEPRGGIVHPTVAIIGAWLVFFVTLVICVLVIVSILR
jgi:hypothetical protein